MKVLAVTNLYPTADNPVSGTFVEQQIGSLRAAGISVDVMYVDRAGEGMTVYRGLGRQVRRRLAACDADLVHVMYGGVMAALVTQAVKERPVIVTFHGSDLLGEPLSGPLRRWIARLGVQASVGAARRAAGLVVVSSVLRDILERTIPGRKLKVIPCGIDLTQFRPLDRAACRTVLGWSQDDFHVLFPANNGNPIKRPALARAAVDAVNALGYPTMLHHLRGVGHDQVPIWLNGSDALLMTSLHEGSPSVVKEALGCGIPVVSVDVGDVRERITGVEGCHLAENTPQDLAAKLAAVFAGSRRLRNREKIEELSLDRVALELVSFYREVFDSWRKHSVGNAAPEEKASPYPTFS